MVLVEKGWQVLFIPCVVERFVCPPRYSPGEYASQINELLFETHTLSRLGLREITIAMLGNVHHATGGDGQRNNNTLEYNLISSLSATYEQQFLNK